MSDPYARPRPFAALFSAIVVVALFAAVIARLRRVPRPRLEPMGTYASGRVGLARVVLARRGETGQIVGWSVTCGGREVVSGFGARVPRVLADGADGVRVRDEDHARTIAVRGDDCRVRIAP